MSAKHTPGPWRVAENGFFAMAVETSSGINITHEAGYGTRISGPEKEANARLISAAPELLQALKESVPHLEYMAGGMTHAPWKTKKAQECLERVLAVIAKAEVET